MANPKPQPDFDLGSVAKLIETLQQTLPFLEKLVATGRDFLSKTPTTSTPLPCDSCQKQDHCSEPCDALNAQLPGVYYGRGHREHLSELDLNNLQSFKKVRLLEVFEQYEDCCHIFTPKQWVAVYLHFHDGKTQEEIARKIGKARTTVNGLLARAKRRKEKYYKKIRQEKIEYLRKKDQD